MKSRTNTLIIAIAFFAVLALPVQLAAMTATNSKIVAAPAITPTGSFVDTKTTLEARLSAYPDAQQAEGKGDQDEKKKAGTNKDKDDHGGTSKTATHKSGDHDGEHHGSTKHSASHSASHKTDHDGGHDQGEHADANHSDHDQGREAHGAHSTSHHDQSKHADANHGDDKHGSQAHRSQGTGQHGDSDRDNGKQGGKEKSDKD